MFLFFLLSACGEYSAQTAYPFAYNGRTMGTSFSIKVSRLPDNIDATRLKQTIDERLLQLNAQMSTYLQDSELSLFNQNRSTDWQPVSEALYTVLSAARQISELSNGAFDITVGKLVNSWGFGPDPMTFVAPEQSIIDQEMAQMGYRHLQIRAEPMAIKKAIPDLYLDLSAIAKGFAVDEVADILQQAGISDYMVEIGGELRLKGGNLTNKPWRIAVEKPTPEKRMIQTVFPFTNTALATSGDYRNFFEQDGVRFSHTIDPRTGNPIKHKLASVTVLNDKCMLADALATAFMVLGPDEGYQLAEKQGIAALFIIKTEEGFEQKATSAFTLITR